MNLGGTIRVNRTGLFIVLCIAIFILFYLQTSKKSDIQSVSSNNQVEISLRELLYSSIEAAQRGGREIRNVKTLDIKSKGKTKEGANDSVTNADIKSHCAMYHSLSQTFPHLQIVSEEKTVCDDDNLKIDLSNLGNVLSNIPDVTVPINEITVWIDPLDATQEYTENKFQYVTTMVCVAIKGKPIIGVVHKPFSNKTSFAWDGKIKSEDLHKPVEHSIDNPTVIISLSHAGEVAQDLKKTFGEDVKIIKAAGAGYKALEVAAGNATIYYHITQIKKWDICAGNAIINSLGGKMTTSYNDEIDYSALGKVVNDKGLIATIYNHDSYVSKLGNQKMQ